MVNCPKCGTPNPDNSRVCSKCGTSLSAPASGGRRCPMCGKVNSPTNVMCESCGARLVPLVASAPDSTIVKKSTAPAPPPSSPKAEVTAPAASDEWLNNLRGTLASAPQEDDVPDWLRGDQLAPSEPEPPTIDLNERLGGAGSSKVPDWLKQVSPAPAKSPPAPSEPKVPDWLKQISSAPAPQAAPASASSEPDVPDWLKPAPSMPAQVAPASAASEPEVPDWLKQPLPPSSLPVASVKHDAAREARPKPTAAAIAPSAAPQPGQVPDWLRQLETASTLPVAPVPQPSQSEMPHGAPLEPTPEAELPDWLKQLAPAAFEAEAPKMLASTSTPVEAKATSEPETPAWLQDLTPPVEAVPAAGSLAFVGEPLPAPTETPRWLADLGESQTQPPQAEAALPGWLKELEPQSAASAPSVEPAASAPEAVPEMPSELPDWLQELEPAETEAAPQAVFTGVPLVQPPPVPEAGGLVAAQLPSWLQQLQPTGEGKKEPEKEPAETEGVLAGLHGPLPVAPVIAQPFSGTPRTVRPEIPAADLARAGALQELLARGPSVVIRRAGESRAQKLWANTQRWIIFVVILAFALIPLLSEQLAPSLVSQPTLGEAGNALYEAIGQLGPNAPVLMAFDYDASQSPEMDTLARVVLRHLVARKANVQIVSLYPSGPAVASTIVRTIGGAVENKGYLVSQDIGIASTLDEASAAKKPYAMVIELAATPDTLRLWVEQLSARSGAPLLYAGVSAGAEPMSRAYYYSRRSDGNQQVSGLLVGVPDAAAYQLKLQKDVPGDQDSLARILAPLASISLANTALVLLMAVGGLIHLVAGGRRQ